jgi:hypothetical protein
LIFFHEVKAVSNMLYNFLPAIPSSVSVTASNNLHRNTQDFRWAVYWGE